MERNTDLSSHPAELVNDPEYLQYLCALCSSGAFEDEEFCRRLSAWVPVSLYTAVVVDQDFQIAAQLIKIAAELFDAVPELLGYSTGFGLLEGLCGYRAANEVSQRELETLLTYAVRMTHEAVLEEHSETYWAAACSPFASFEFCFDYLRAENLPERTAAFIARYDTRRLRPSEHAGWWKLACSVCWKPEDEGTLREKAKFVQPSQGGLDWMAMCGIHF